MNGGEAITSRHIILIIIMSKFFYPFIGKDYNQGINGKRVLILGASFYCPKVDCKYYKDCTDTKTKDSSKYDMKWYKLAAKNGYERATKPLKKYQATRHRQSDHRKRRTRQ